MKKLICGALIFAMLMPLCVNAEFVPESSMSAADAMKIYDRGDITGGYMMDVDKHLAMKLSNEQINMFYNAAVNTALTRRVTKNPFGGVCIVLHTAQGEKTYFLESGVEVGKYGNDSYLCYDTRQTNETFDTLYLNFMSSNNKYAKYDFTVNTATDYLNYPTEQWAVDDAIFAASNCLMPFEIGQRFGISLSREDFCSLIGNFIAVSGNYASLEDYLRDKNIAYLTNYFTDTDSSNNTVNMLHALGLVNGVSSDKFAPGDPLTREQAAVIIKKTADMLGISGKTEQLKFTDKKRISSWAADAVKFVSANGIMNGTDGFFNPDAFINTEQAVAGVNRLFKLSLNK